MRIRLIISTVFSVLVSVTGYAQLTFKGGPQALDSFLASNIIYPEYSRQNCIPGTIRVSFKVDNSGEVSNVTVQSGLGIDLDDEAVRVVKLTARKWIVPAGYNINSDIILPIRFSPDATRCQGVNEASIATAITNYKNQQELENAVTNYYKNKYAGKADPAGEPQIIALKKQLGYDDDFIDDVLSQANQKLKQGDKAGACESWNFIRNIGSNKADNLIARYCSK